MDLIVSDGASLASPPANGIRMRRAIENEAREAVRAKMKQALPMAFT